MYSKYSYDFRAYKLDLVIRRLEFFMLKHRVATLRDTVATILFNKSAS